jgi:FkbM family methyltransferase
MLAFTSRAAPFERGRWRIGSLAYGFLGAPCAQAREIVKTRHGFDMSLDLAQFVDRTIYCTGEWEPLETQLIKQVLCPGDTFVDVGANIGYFTLLASRLVGPTGRVCAIEANAATFALLQANLELNRCSNVDAHLLAAGESAGFATVVSSDAGNAGGDHAEFAAEAQAGSVAANRLDWLLADAVVDLIKLDIEGAEAKAIRGAAGLLRRKQAPDLIFEFTPRFLQRAGDDPAELLQFLKLAGYRLQLIEPAGLTDAADGIGGQEQVYLYCSKRGG